ECLREQTHSDWVAACLPRMSDPTGFEAAQAQEFLRNEGADCEFVVFALAGTIMARDALQRLASAFAGFEAAKAGYADLDMVGADETVFPLAMPAFDCERLMEQGYCAHFFALRRGVAHRALSRGASNLYAVFGAILDDPTLSTQDIVHLPNPIATLPAFD